MKARRRLPVRRASRARLLVVLGALIILSGCATSYEVQNGPRGPERIENKPAWPAGSLFGCSDGACDK